MPKRIMEGVVVSAKAARTAVVRIDRTFLHPVLKKTVRRSSKYHVHDEAGTAFNGQTVRIRECSPRSKMKRWEIIEKKDNVS